MCPSRNRGFPASLGAATLLALCLSSPAWAGEPKDEQPLPQSVIDGQYLSLEGMDNGTSYYTELHPCPAACEGPSSNWTIYSSYDRFRRCDEPVLLSFSLVNPVDDDNTPTKISTCTLGNADTTVNSLFNGTSAGVDTPPSEVKVASSRSKDKRQEGSGGDCESSAFRKAAAESKLSLELAEGGADPHLGDKRDRAAQVVLQQLQVHFADGGPCEESVMFAYYRGVAAGVYIGPSFGRASVAAVSRPLLERIQAGPQATFAAQLCGEHRNAHHVLGLVVDTSGNITAVQQAVRGWNDAKCLTTLESTAEMKDVTVWEDKRGLGPFEDLDLLSPSGNGTLTNSAANSTVFSDAGAGGFGVWRRADCRTEQVVSGDGCAALASRCGVSGADFMKYNSASNFCATLVPGQRVCCSSGSLPDVRPKPGSDGVCATHRVVAGDTCASLAAANGIKVSDINDFNKGTTWGWYSCDRLLVDTNICLSKGDPPLPFPISNAQCGPTKPGTKNPLKKELKELNPCPLNACCNVWGQCGHTKDFCTVRDLPDGNPGTSALQNGCVSSCGMEIVNMDKPPKSGFGRIGYYESWNFGRPCLWMTADNANTDGTYTIMHWAFAEINKGDWTVKIVDPYNQWKKFKSLSCKKVISFGGWAFSNEPLTYDDLRQAMSADNRQRFATNVARFVYDEGLDGVDFDWEYPGAKDIPGTPPGTDDDGRNYLLFLSTMRSSLWRLPGANGNDRYTLSIAAPASFWYLKNFPMSSMSALLDYIVYMTYDLHGQWDTGNQWATDGCPAGNCIRSHVNLTEVNAALVMITKAGVRTNQIYVGESSYGRSFKLAQPGCVDPMCTYLGTRLVSPAAKGRCTETGGYISNAEINEIIISGEGNSRAWHDGASNSDMLLYNGDEWVAYMTPTTKQTRRQHWEDYNFAGTIDWAVDLQSFRDEEFLDRDNLEDGLQEEPLWPRLSGCADRSFDSIEAVEQASPPFHCAPVYMADVLARTLSKSMNQYQKLIQNGYDRKFDTYATAVAAGGNKAIREFMYKNGNKYFECTVREPVPCCKHCHYYNTLDGDRACRYCDDRVCNGWSPDCLKGKVQLCNGVKQEYFDVGPNCPPDFSKRAGDEPTGGYQQSIRWRLLPSRARDFWQDFTKTTGITQQNVKWEDKEFRNSCSYKESVEICGWDLNFPVTDGYDKDAIPNPVDVIKAAHDNLKNFANDLPEAAKRLREGKYTADAWDLVDAVSLPVLMVEQAVEAIQSISETVDKWEDEKRKNIILAFLSGILFLVPIIGQLASAVNALATVGRIIAILGAAGQLALDIYDVVDTEGNDAMAIFSLVLTPLAVFDAVQMAKAANRARNMSPSDRAKMGTKVEDRMASIKRAGLGVGVCKPKAKRDVTVFPDGALPMSGLNANPFQQF